MERGFWIGLLLLASCGDDTSGGSSDNGLGAPTPLQWIDTSTTSINDGTDTPLLWNDPATAPPPPPPVDSTDVRTYTSPDIYILGNRHPLMTVVTSRTHPGVLAKEERLTQILNEFRYMEYVRLIGSSLPSNARLVESLLLRANARAHAKHYAVWIPNTALPLVNEEGDSVWYSNPIGGPGIEHLPTLGTVIGAQTGRLPKSLIQVDLAGQLVASGPGFREPDVLARHWIDTFPDFLRFAGWTHIGVGYWSSVGNGIDNYWNAVFAKNPRPTETTQPTIPGFGF